jgi:tetratricopeptide (TPR) repeat protein
MTLVPLVRDHKHDAMIRVAHLRALMGCGKVKEAVITNKDIVKDLSDDHDGLLLLADSICDMAGARSLAGVADKAISLVLAKDATSEAHQLLRYRVLKLLGREQEAREVGRALVQGARRTGLSLNNWVWYLMTKRDKAGKYPTLALLGAEEMMKAPGHSGYELDTIALALFRAGRLQQAVDYQERAIKAGGDAGYTARLKIYRDALQAADAGKPKDR